MGVEGGSHKNRMPKMPAKAKPSQKKAAPDPGVKLVDAGLRILATGIPASRLNAKSVAAEAKLRPTHFATSFPRWEDYLLILLKRLSEEVRAEAVKAIALKTPGRPLIREGISTYLDTILQRPALLEITYLLRAHPVCQQITRDRMTSLVMLATLLLKMVDVKNAEGIGQLGMAMLFEITHAEYEARRALPDYRNTIDSYFVRS